MAVGTFFHTSCMHTVHCNNGILPIFLTLAFPTYDHTGINLKRFHNYRKVTYTVIGFSVVSIFGV